MGAPQQSIFLYGFDFQTQSKLRFDHTWAAAFLTPRYTNEGHEDLAYSSYATSSEKKREVKYGNNVAVLFAAMLHLAEAGGQLQEGFWHAIARGLNTNPKCLNDTSRVLTEARKVHRMKPSKDVSETARRADDWIEFMDNRKTNNKRPLLLSQQIDIVVDYLKNFQGNMINAAGIPLTSHIRGPDSYKGNGRRVSSPGYFPEDVSPTAHMPPGLSIKTEPPTSPTERDRYPTGPRAARKRSPSPVPAAYSPTAKRACGDAGAGSLISPRERLPPGMGSVSTPRTLGSHVIMPPQSSDLLHRRTTSSDEISDPSRQLLDEGGAMLRGRAEELKMKLSKSDGHIENLAAIKDVNKEVSDLKDEMQGMKAVMEVMMESMHAVADNLNTIKDDIASLRTQPDGLKSDPFPESLTSIIQPIQSLSENFNRLREDFTNLKTQVQKPAPPVAAKPDKEVRELLLEQSSRISRLASEMTRVQSQLGSPAGSSAAPQSLRQALAAAEHDMRHHMHTVQTFYNRNGAITNRTAAEKTADLLIALENGLKCAQNSLQG